jgi:regulator of replication initiation timing
MRARRREINIFNLSLLDVLCGALGAFCFMMLVALPYYRPSQNPAQVREQQEKIEQLMRDMEKLKNKMGDSSAGQDLEALMRQLRAQIQALQGQVNQLTAENEQLRTDKQQLSAQNQQLTQENNELRQRSPFVVVEEVVNGAELDLYVEHVDTRTTTGEKNPPFDPAKKHHTTYWPSDAAVFSAKQCVWLVRDMPAGSHFKIYVKADPLSAMTTAYADGAVFSPEFTTIPLPKVMLTTSRSWNLVGTLTCSEPGKLTFAEATQAEREAAWKELAKNTPAPIPAPSAAPTTPASFPFGREREQRASPSPTAMP